MIDKKLRESLHGSKDGRGYTSSYTYNPEGWLTNSVTPYNGSAVSTIEYTYDMLGNKTVESIAVDSSTTRTTSYIYDYRGNVLQASTGSDKAIYTYDPVGNLTSQVIGKNKETAETQYQYDGLNRLVKITDSLGNTERYVYTGLYMTSKTDRNGVTTAYTNDALGRVISETAGGKTTTYAYGKTGALITQSNENATITNRYNEKGLPRSVRTDYGSSYNEIYYTYTDDGKLASYIAYNNQGSMGGYYNYKYTSEGNLKTVLMGTQVKAEYTYDTASNLLSASYNGGQIRKDYSYYDNNALKTVKNQRKNGSSYAVVSQYTCEYLFDGNLSHVYNGSNEHKSYIYSPTGRLTGETYTKGSLTETTAYTYDSRGNRLTSSFTSSQNTAANYTRS